MGITQAGRAGTRDGDHIFWHESNSVSSAYGHDTLPSDFCLTDVRDAAEYL